MFIFVTNANYRQVENFILKFEYREKPHILEVRPWVQQYKAVYRVAIEGHDITFEEDEEGHLRAVGDSHAHTRRIDPGLLQDVARRIEEVINGEG